MRRPLSCRRDMGYRTPNTVALMVNAEDPHGDPRTSGRSAPLGVAAKTVDAAIQSHEHTVQVHHADSSHIAAIHGFS